MGSDYRGLLLPQIRIPSIPVTLLQVSHVGLVIPPLR
jgi:hypothetical protein